MNRNENEVFKTKDFYLACFLKTKDIKLIKTSKEGNISFFYFENEGNIEELITSFYGDNEMVPANKFINAIRDLKALIHNIK